MHIPIRVSGVQWDETGGEVFDIAPATMELLQKSYHCSNGHILRRNLLVYTPACSERGMEDKESATFPQSPVTVGVRQESDEESRRPGSEGVISIHVHLDRENTNTCSHSYM